jgi:hypothetical protein
MCQNLKSDECKKFMDFLIEANKREIEPIDADLLTDYFKLIKSSSKKIFDDADENEYIQSLLVENRPENLEKIDFLEFFSLFIRKDRRNNRRYHTIKDFIINRPDAKQVVKRLNQSVFLYGYPSLELLGLANTILAPVQLLHTPQLLQKRDEKAEAMNFGLSMLGGLQSILISAEYKKKEAEYIEVERKQINVQKWKEWANARKEAKRLSQRSPERPSPNTSVPIPPPIPLTLTNLRELSEKQINFLINFFIKRIGNINKSMAIVEVKDIYYITTTMIKENDLTLFLNLLRWTTQAKGDEYQAKKLTSINKDSPINKNAIRYVFDEFFIRKYSRSASTENLNNKMRENKEKVSEFLPSYFFEIREDINAGLLLEYDAVVIGKFCIKYNSKIIRKKLVYVYNKSYRDKYYENKPDQLIVNENFVPFKRMCDKKMVCFNGSTCAEPVLFNFLNKAVPRSIENRSFGCFWLGDSKDKDVSDYIVSSSKTSTDKLYERFVYHDLLVKLGNNVFPIISVAQNLMIACPGCQMNFNNILENKIDKWDHTGCDITLPQEEPASAAAPICPGSGCESENARCGESEAGGSQRRGPLIRAQSAVPVNIRGNAGGAAVAPAAAPVADPTAAVADPAVIAKVAAEAREDLAKVKANSQVVAHSVVGGRRRSHTRKQRIHKRATKKRR